MLHAHAILVRFFFLFFFESLRIPSYKWEKCNNESEVRTSHSLSQVIERRKLCTSRRWKKKRIKGTHRSFSFRYRMIQFYFDCDAVERIKRLGQKRQR